MLLFSHEVVSDSLWPHGLQHPGLPCPSPSPRVCPNSCLLSWWCHPIISSSVAPFFSCPQSGSFPKRQLFSSGGQSTGASVSASVLPMNIQGWLPLGLTRLISVQSKKLSRVFSSTTINSLAISLFYSPSLKFIHDYWKKHTFDCMDLCWPSDVFAF